MCIRDRDRLEVLGRGDGLLRTGGQDIRLGRRQAEILFVLSAHPLGVSGEQLADALFEDGTGAAAVRVELTRLRRQAGDLVQSRPYRLARPLDSDYADVCAALRRGDTAGALAACPGPLLPSSEAPHVVTQRRWLDVRLRSAVLASGSPRLLSEWAERFGFEDLQVWERLAAVLPARSGQRASAAARARELRADYGLPADVAFA